MNELLDFSENIKLSDLRKFKENFNPSSRLNEQIVSSFIKELEESELIKRAQIPESSEKERESLNVSEIKALLTKISEGNYNKHYFIESSALLQSFKNYRESLEEFSVCKFLLACSSIAKDFLDYSKWLKLTNLFWSWDEQFAEEFSKDAPRLLNSLILRKKKNRKNLYVDDYKDLRRRLSELNTEKCGCHVKYSDLIFEAIKDAVERKINLIELRTIVRIALEAVESTQEKLYALNNLYKTLRKAYNNSNGDLTLTKSSKRLYSIWHKF